MQLLLIPPLSVVAAIAWNAWVSRDRKPSDVVSTVEAHRRVLAALAPHDKKLFRR